MTEKNILHLIERIKDCHQNHLGDPILGYLYPPTFKVNISHAIKHIGLMKVNTKPIISFRGSYICPNSISACKLPEDPTKLSVPQIRWHSTVLARMEFPNSKPTQRESSIVSFINRTKEVEGVGKLLRGIGCAVPVPLRGATVDRLTLKFSPFAGATARRLRITRQTVRKL